jgi:hypothetical protein
MHRPGPDPNKNDQQAQRSWHSQALQWNGRPADTELRKNQLPGYINKIVEHHGWQN